MPTIDIEENDRRIQYTATAGQTEFDYDFLIFNNTDITVVQDGVTLELTTDYTVSGVGVEAGGTITLVSGAALNDVVTIFGASSISRGSQYQVDGRFDAAPLERDLDRVFTILQEQGRNIDRSVSLDIDSALTSISLPTASANKVIAWNDAADGLENGPSVVELTTATSTAVASAATATSAAATATSAASTATTQAGIATTQAELAEGYAASLNLPVLGGGNDFLHVNSGGTALEYITVAQTKTLLGIKFNNDSATTAPTVNDDADDGYEVGSRWVDITADNIYFCVDPTVGAAVWELGDLEITDLGAAAVKGFTTDLSSPSNDDVAGALATKNYIDLTVPNIGCNIENDTTDAEHDIKITAGKKISQDNTVVLQLDNFLIKQADASFVAGNNQGGLSSSLSLANSTWYHVFLVKIGSTVDVLFDTDFDCVNGITDHGVTAYRHIGDFLTDSSANILGFTKIGRRVIWKTLSVDTTIAAVSGSGTLGAIKVPPNQNVKAQLTAQSETAGNQKGISLTSPLSDDIAAVWSTGGAIVNMGGSNNTGSFIGVSGYSEVITDTSKQIRARTSSGSFTVYITTHGWEYLV